MSSTSLFQRLLGRHSLPAEGPTHIDISPPKPWGHSESAGASIWHWLRDTPRAAAARPQRTLDAARDEFTAALVDLDSRDATDLRRRTRHAHSLRELWHLRPELYGVVARHLSQAEADRRLALINRHFPTRAPRSATTLPGLRDGHRRPA